MTPPFAALAFAGRHGTLVMPAGVILGLLFPALTELTRPLAEPVVMLMLTLSIYRLSPSLVVERLRRPLIIGGGMIWILVAIPVLVYGIGRVLDLPAGLLAVLTAWGASAPLVSMPGLALILGLDGAAALLVMIGSTFVFTLTLPVLLAILLGEGFGLDPSAISVKLLVMVTICCVIGQGARWLVGKRRAEDSAEAADGALVVLMLVFAITIMGGLHDALDREPARIPLFLAAAFAVSAGVQVVTATVFQSLHRPLAGSIALASGGRNLALLLPVAGEAIMDDLWLYLAVIQFPIYLLPAISKPIYKWYCGER